jgi:hypothetical protein
MKTHLFKTTFLISLATSWLALSASALPIQNGGFETGDLDGWSTPAVFYGGVTSAGAYAGSYCLEMHLTDFVWQDIATLKRFGRLRFKAKGSGPSGSASASAIVCYQDLSSSALDFGGASLSSGDWTAFELALDSTKRIIRVYFTVEVSTPIYLDNVALLD